MNKQDISSFISTYNRDGFVSPVRLLSADQALRHRRELENAEQQIGDLHYKPKVHTILRSPFELVTLPSVLDIVEQMIGPDILLYNVTYIIKEPGSKSHVSWHQDLTYWGLSHDDQVSMWLALSPATKQSGCMRMVPGSHLAGVVKHQTGDDQNNVLFQSQTVEGVNEEKAAICQLQAGEASFHHGWTLHASQPNCSDERRIGLNVQYLATHVRQTKHDNDSALLVRGKDTFHHFESDIGATANLDPEAIKHQEFLEDRYKSIVGKG